MKDLEEKIERLEDELASALNQIGELTTENGELSAKIDALLSALSDLRYDADQALK